ncbi:MAG: PqqD family protein [Candidatus Aminicenantes bacterium]|nr:MAG: PqqD family protein [Candidatus Aminicenantes bacterium]
MAKIDKKVNFLDLIPEKNCQWEKTEDGRTSLVVPRFKNPFMKKIALKLGRSEFIKIHLDSLGSKVWDLIDGSTTVERIGKLLEEEKQEATHQLYERLTKFLSILSQHKFIRLRSYHE